MHQTNVTATLIPWNNHHKGGDDKKKNLICQTQGFQAEIHLLNLLKLHLDCSSHQMQFGSDLPKFYYICKFTSHCCFFLPAKAFKISQSRYLESVWQSATGHVTEGEWRERGERGKCWGPSSVSWYKSKVPDRNFFFHLKTTGSPYIWVLLKWWVETSIQ